MISGSRLARACLSLDGLISIPKKSHFVKPFSNKVTSYFKPLHIALLLSFFLPNIRFYSVTSLRKYHAISAHILLRILPEGVVILQSFSGIFNSRHPGVFLDAPCLQLGRHFLSGKGAARSGPIAALAVGHIRNAAALRRELGPSTAATFSELLLQAYRAWGEDCVRRVEGPCALIVIDQEHDRLLLSRDRMGEVPFYYSIRSSEVLFGSHPAPLLRLGVLAEVDSSGLCEVFGLGPARTPGKTPYRDLLALEPGHMLTVQSGRAKVRAYFELTAREHTDSLPDTVEAVRSLLAQAVADAAPLEPAAMLSGGLDSCALTALLARQSDRPVVTYSVDYEGNEQFFKGGSYQPEQDAPYVELAAQAIGTRHERIVLPIPALASRLTRRWRRAASRAWQTSTARSTSLPEKSPKVIATRCRANVPTRCSAAIRGSIVRRSYTPTASPGAVHSRSGSEYCGLKSPKSCTSRNTSATPLPMTLARPRA